MKARSSSRAAPVDGDSTSAPSWSTLADRYSLATRFMPSWSEVTAHTSASRYQGIRSRKSRLASMRCTVGPPGRGKSRLISAASVRVRFWTARYSLSPMRDGTPIWTKHSFPIHSG
jgi:hypothetical protein